MATLDPYLQPTEIINWTDPAVRALAAELADQPGSPAEIARRCFEWVRDQVFHSVDYQLNPVTCLASDVLQTRTGFCYAKSHLLVALCRANGIAAGMCYQRLQTSAQPAEYCLHGLAAILLPGHGWYRVDPRGNRPGVDAQFTPPREQLAFAIEQPGEADFPIVYADPLPVVVAALRSAHSTQALVDSLPDMPVELAPPADQALAVAGSRAAH
jgi:transglutaminase-like putative cysteine protease